jgi:endonuclease/exonuclease/phosphatase family metal-dependent hydrolase
MREIRLAWYNLENIFEPEQHPELKTSWTRNRYDKKIRNVASVIAELFTGEGPDLLGVCEVQSERVLEDVRAALPNGGAYAMVHHDTPDVRMIDVGFLYRPSVVSKPETRAFNIRKRYPTRDILDVTFRVRNGSVLHVIGNHWPSRSAGQYESEPYRILVAENCAWIVEQHYRSDPEANIVVMGDFNDEPFNRSVQEYLFAIRNRARVQARRNSPRARPYLYNLAWSLLDDPTPGSFYYGSAPSGWNMIDQIMVSKGVLTGSSGLEILEQSMAVFRPKRIRDGSKPKPFRRRKQKWVEGFSDHFPITAILRAL